MLLKPDLKVFSTTELTNILTVLSIFLEVEFICHRNCFALLKKVLHYTACAFTHGPAHEGHYSILLHVLNAN